MLKSFLNLPLERLHLTFTVMNLIKALLLITTALFLGGCASTPKSIAGNYALLSLTDSSTAIDEPIIMHVRDTSIAGSGPVNQWQG